MSAFSLSSKASSRCSALRGLRDENLRSAEDFEIDIDELDDDVDDDEESESY